MKKYVKPTIELVDLKTEERIAGSNLCEKNSNGPTGCSVSNNGINNQWG